MYNRADHFMGFNSPGWSPPLVACSLPLQLHDAPFLHVRALKWVWHGFDSLHGYKACMPDSETIVMNSLLKPWSTALLCFPRHLLTCPFPCPFSSSLFFSKWWIVFQQLSVKAISHTGCPIVPQRRMCGDTEQLFECNVSWMFATQNY